MAKHGRVPPMMGPGMKLPPGADRLLEQMAAQPQPVPVIRETHLKQVRVSADPSVGIDGATIVNLNFDALFGAPGFGGAVDRYIVPFGLEALERWAQGLLDLAGQLRGDGGEAPDEVGLEDAPSPIEPRKGWAEEGGGLVLVPPPAPSEAEAARDAAGLGDDDAPA